MAAEQWRTPASGAQASAERPRQHVLEDPQVASRLQATAGQAAASAHIAVRIVDHASASSASVSNRVAAMCVAAGFRVRAELSWDQPMSACGYIAADAVVRLRDAALAELLYARASHGWQ